MVLILLNWLKSTPEADTHLYSPLDLRFHRRWRTTRTRGETNGMTWCSLFYVYIFNQKVEDLRLTFWMRASTIRYWSGMWVTMWVMLSSVVRTRVGPNTMARFLGSIWPEREEPFFNSSRPITVKEEVCGRVYSPYSSQSCQPQFWDEPRGTWGFRNDGRATREAGGGERGR